MNQLIEEAYRIFKNDRFATECTGIKIQDITDSQVTCILELEEKHLNAMGTVMGGAIYTLADFTFAIASNFHKQPTVTLSSQINYIGTPKGKQLIAQSKLLHEGRTTCFYCITITDELNHLVATVNMNGYIKQLH